MRELYLNDKLIQLSDNELIGITYCANNIGELQNRNSSFSSTIKIPITQENKVSLDWANLVNSATDLPYIKIKATYIENGVELVSNGTAIITSVDENFFSVNIVSGNSDLSELLGDTTVGQLYGDSFFTWSKTNIIASNDKSKPYIHPIIDWRSDSDSFFKANNDIACDYLIPCLRVSDVFNKIEDYINFSFIGSYIATKDHLNMVLTPDFFEVENQVTKTATNKANGLWSEYIDVPEAIGQVTNYLYPRLDVFESGFGWDSIDGITYYQPTSVHIGNLKFATTVSLKWFAAESYGIFEAKEEHHIKVKAYIKGDDGNNYAINECLDVDTKLTYDENFVVTVETGDLYLDPSIRYYPVIEIINDCHQNIPSKISVGKLVSAKDFYTHTDSKTISIDQSINYKDIFRMKVKDVIKDILNLRGLIIQTNSYLRTIQINSFNDLQINKSIAKNWSDKVDSITNLRYTFGQYAQKNYLKFKDFDSVPKEYGDYYFNISNVNLDISKIAVQILHPATEQNVKYLGANIPKIHGLDINAEWQKPQYRLLTLASQNRNVNYIDYVDTTSVTNSIPFCKFESFKDLIPIHYDTLTEILDKTKVITATLKLNGQDVNELDFSIPIYLDVPKFSISNYFYINRINDYRKGLTNVELVRL